LPDGVKGAPCSFGFVTRGHVFLRLPVSYFSAVGASASRKHDFLVHEVHKAAGKFGRIFVRRNGTDMWMKDQYLDILFRWLYLPLYILFASFSLNF